MDYTERWLDACAIPLYQKYHELKAENEGLKIMVKGFEEPLATTDQGSTEPQAQPVVAQAATEFVTVTETPVVAHPVVSLPAIQEDTEPVVTKVASESESRRKLPTPTVAGPLLSAEAESSTSTTGQDDSVDTTHLPPPKAQPDWVAGGMIAALIILTCIFGYFSYSTYKQNKVDNATASQALPAEIVATVDKSKLVWLREQNTCKEVLKQLPKTLDFEKVRLRISFVKKLKTASKLTQHHALATCWLTANFANQKVKQVRNYLFKLEKNNGKYPNGVAVSATTIKKGKEPLLYLEKVQGMKKLFTSHDSKDSLGTATVGYFQVRVEKPGWFDWLWN
jgi:hypothetical protein